MHAMCSIPYVEPVNQIIGYCKAWNLYQSDEVGIAFVKGLILGSRTYSVSS